MLVKIRKSDNPVEHVISPEGAALMTAQSPGELFRLRPHSQDTNPFHRVRQLLNGEWDCTLIDKGEFVTAHKRGTPLPGQDSVIRLANGSTIPKEPQDGRHDSFQGLVNHTPHDIRVVTPGAACRDFILNRRPEVEPIRIPELRGVEEYIGEGIWIQETSYDPNIVLPPPNPDRLYVVSQVVLMCLIMAGIHRPDFVAPDTGAGALRDQSGQIVGTTGFVRIKKGNNR